MISVNIFVPYFLVVWIYVWIFFIIISWLYAASTQQFIFFPCNANQYAGSNIFCISLLVKS